MTDAASPSSVPSTPAPRPTMRPWPFVFLAWAAAAATGAVVAAFELTMFQLLLYVIGAQPHLEVDMPGLGGVLIKSTAVFGLAFGLGGLALGTPIWWGLRALDIRAKGAAMVMGALLAGVTSALPPLLMLGPAGLIVSVPGGLAMAVAGAASGWVAHRIAYGPTSDWF